MTDRPPPLSVTQLTARIKQMLEQGFVGIQVSGEISRLTRHTSGHLYFTIKDAHAAISAVVWRSAAMRLSTLPEEGREYIFTGHLSVYEPRGTYQLVVTRIESAGAGKLAAEYERRKQLFAERGWFDPAGKKQLPALPQHIGIITSPTAAAFEDVKKVLATRPAWLLLTLAPCLVQGASAPASIVSALQSMSAMENCPDVILLVRGGGSIEDLWCFNDESVVKAVMTCPVPVIAGIGHEIDVTLTDFAADLRAATPSNAAELACPSRQDLHRQLPRTAAMAGILRQKLGEMRHHSEALNHRQQYAWQRLNDASHHRLEQLQALLLHQQRTELHKRRNQLRMLEKRLSAMEPGQQLHARRHRLGNSMNQLHQMLHATLQRKQRAALALHQRLCLAAGAMLPPRRQLLLPQSLRLKRLQQTHIPELRQRLALNCGRLAAYDKEDILARGYSLNYDTDNRLVTRVASLQPGALLRVEFGDGSADTRIESIKRSPTL